MLLVLLEQTVFMEVILFDSTSFKPCSGVDFWCKRHMWDSKPHLQRQLPPKPHIHAPLTTKLTMFICTITCYI